MRVKPQLISFLTQFILFISAGFLCSRVVGVCLLACLSKGDVILVSLFVPVKVEREVSQWTASEKETLQRFKLRNNEVRWENICQHSHSSPKYLILKERCEKQRWHKGRKTNKLSKWPFWRVDSLKRSHYHASEKKLVLILKERNEKRQRERNYRVRIVSSCSYSSHLILQKYLVFGWL